MAHGPSGQNKWVPRGRYTSAPALSSRWDTDKWMLVVDPHWPTVLSPEGDVSVAGPLFSVEVSVIDVIAKAESLVYPVPFLLHPDFMESDGRWVVEFSRAGIYKGQLATAGPLFRLFSSASTPDGAMQRFYEEVFLPNSSLHTVPLHPVFFTAPGGATVEQTIQARHDALGAWIRGGRKRTLPVGLK